MSKQAEIRLAISKEAVQLIVTSTIGETYNQLMADGWIELLIEGKDV